MARLKRQPKKGGSAHPGIARFIQQLQTVEQHELPSLLAPLLQSGWQWPRTDMQHWIHPLNRFDEILETVIRDYDLGSMEHLQTNEFTPRTKELVLSVLAFQKLLLENSTNRKIFNGFDRINDLLHTTDITVLLATLRLALRPAQQYSSYNSSLSSIPFSEKRLLSLAQPWGTREHGIDLMQIAQDGQLEVPLELQEPEWQFYRKVDKATTDAAAATSDDKPKSANEMEVEAAEPAASTSATVSTPAPPRRTASFAPHLQTPSRETAPSGSALLPNTPSTPAAGATTSSDKPQEGLTTLHLPNLRTSTKSTVDILLDSIEAHQVPEADRLDLLQRIRIGKALCSSDPSERHRLLIVRLLALSVFAHAQSEQSAQLKVFLYEPDIIAQIAELVHPEKDVPVEIKSVALYALEAFARYKGKTAEVASALNASVSHGVLMELVRKTAADLDTAEPESTAEFIDALFNVLTYINVHQAIGQMVIGAGIVNVLLDFVKISSRGHLQMVAANKAIVILDGFLYGYTNAFTAFIAANGLDAFIGRVKSEVDGAVEEHREEAEKLEVTVIENSTGLLSFQQGSVLKSILRAIHRLMTTSGTTEGLRNLIDTSLLSSVKKVMENRFIFGPQVFALVTNIAATFVHNEPTSLTTLQEAKVPDALYDSLERAIPASNDVLQAVPNAIGAFCLNQAGLDHFLTRDLIAKYFAIFTSPAHYELLRDRDSAVNLGSAIDELVRHHPTLKAKILDTIFSIFVEFKRMGAGYVPPASESGYNLKPTTSADATSTTTAAGSSEDVAMQEGAAQGTEEEQATKDKKKAEEEKTKDNEVTNAIDVFGRFLEGLFQNVGHTQDFIEHKGKAFDLLLDLLELPCSPAIMLKNGGYSSIVALFRISSEIKAAEALTAILGRTDKWLNETKWFWEPTQSDDGDRKSTLAAMVHPSADEFDTQQKRFRDLTILLSHVSLLSDVFTNLGYAHGKAATAILSVFTVKGPQAEILQRIGQVYRACLWENVTIRPTSFWSGEASKAATEQLAKDAPEGEAPTPAVAVARERQQAQAADVAAREVISTPATPDSPNIKLVQDVVQSFTRMTLPLYQTIVKLLVHRRSPDAAHRKVARAVAQQIASFMRDTLAWPNAHDLPANLAYSAQSLILVTKLHLDERPNGLQTLLLRQFVLVGGLDAYVALFKKLLEVSSEYFASAGDDASAASPMIIPVFGALKTALDFLGRITKQKTIFEASQTALLISRETDPTSPDYFDAPAFLVRLRHDSLPVLRSAWEQPWLRKCPQNVIRSLVSTLINIIKADGEAPSEAPARPERILGQVLGDANLGAAGGLLNALGAVFGGGAGGGGAAAILGGPGGAAAGADPRAPIGQAGVPDEQRISQLIDMGFPRSASETALRRCRNSVAMATEFLLQHPDLVGAAREEEARRLLDPAPTDDGNAAAGPSDGQANAAEAQPAADQPAPATEEAAPAEAAPVEAAQPPADVAMEDATPAAAAASHSAEVEMVPAAQEAAGPSVDEMRANLKAARSELAPTFVSRTLELAEEYGDLVFDVKAVFGQIGADENDRNAGAAFTALLDDLRTRASAHDAEKDAACAARLRLIALLATDATFRDTVDPLRTEIMAVAMLFNAKYSSLSPAKDARPIWLAPFMLVADAMLSLSGVPTTTTILPESEEVPSAGTIERGPAWTEEKKALFETALDLLEKGVSTRDVFISTLRLLLFLTRNAGCALSFVERGGLRLLLSTFSVEAPETKNCHSYAVMIMRHLVEDKALLKPMMEREIEAWFGGTRSKVADASGFVRGVGAIAARDLETFLEAAQTTVKLVQADAPAHYHVTLQRDPAANAKDVEHEPLKSPLNQDTAGETADVGMTDTAALQKAGGKTSLTPAPSTTETVVHFLMQQALDLVKPALAPIPAAPPAPESAAADKKEAQDSREGTAEQAQKKDNKDAHISPDVPLGDFYQSAFSLASLAELVASYNSCKTSFFTFSTRKGASKEAVAPRSRSSFLFFLLNELVPTSCLVPSTDFDSKRIASMWGWASLVIVGLCYDATAASVGTAGDRDLAQDITFVRKAVLDALARAFRDAMNSNEPTEARYSRLASLSDLCHRLLTARPFPSVGRPHSETSMLLAKLMLEKNFAVILTNALADVDLNFPHVNNLINAILRPLENLTKIATKLGRAKNSATGSGATKKREVLDDYTTEDSSMLSGDESDSNDSASDEDDEAQEQAAADLYRHSALGMYEGELEQGHPEEFMSADEEDFDDDDEMMEEMDDFDGSDISDASDDEDDDDEDDEHGAQRQEFSDADMEELADDDEADLDTDDAGSAINESDVEEEILIEGEEGGDLVDGLDALEGDFDEEEGDWIDAEDEEGLPGGRGADGDQLLFDEGGPIRDGDEEDDIDDGGDSDGGFTDEEEVLTGELEFDPEMTEQLRAQSTAQAYGWDPVTGGDGSGNRRNRGTAEDMLLSDAMFDRPQVPPRTAPDHPLLTESAAADSRADAPARRPRGNGATSRESAAYQEWVRSVETMLGPGGVDTLQEVLGAQGLGHLSGPDQLRIQLAPGPNGGMAVVIDPSPGLRAGHVAHHAHHEHRGPVSGAPAQQSARSVARQLSDRINAASAFLPMQTSQRWHEEREIFQGCYLVSERAARLTNHLINALHPAARAEAKVEKAKTEEKRKKEEQEAAEKKKKQEEEEAAKKAAEAAEAEKKKKEEEEEEEAARQASRQAEEEPAAASMEVDSTSPTTDDVPDDIAEVMNLARSLAAGLAVPAVSEAPSRQATPAVPLAEASSDQSAGQTAPPSQAAAPNEASGSGSGPPAAAEEAPAPAQERVTVLVHGEEVDITDTGIDREFLEALPDDMRDEVISQHFRENRIRSTGPPPAVASSISSEFLDALPPALRAEVMRNEAEDQRRQQEAAASGGARAPAAEAEDEPEPAEEDVPRDFLAALDPHLRSAVLGEGAAGGLLGGLLGAAVPDRHRYARRTGAPVGLGGGFDSGRRAHGGPSGAAPESSTAKKPAQQREVIQLLDKSGLATLVRLLFFPHPLKRGLLQKVLVNLCENTRTRIELVNLLLTILQDGTRDVSAVDKSFSQMSLRASRALAPKDTPKRRAPETPGNVLPHLPGESVPNLIAQRCLDALIFLVAANEQTPLYFLTEQELPMSRRAAKKGKGKEKAAPTMTYPIVVLLGLLERPGLLKTPAMMEAVMSLLASISRSLQVLQKKAGSSAADAPATATATGADATTSAPSAATDASASASAPAADSTSAPPPASDKGKQKEAAASDPKDATDLTKNPPKIPPASLRLVVNVLDAGECSSRTFSSTLSLIQNLSNLPGARDTILDELKLRAEKISNEIVPHLVELLDTINRDEPVGGAVLGNFTPASSSQAKLLRILKTIDFFGTPPKKTAGGPAGKPASQPLSPDEEQIKTIYSSLATSDLWKRLGDALGGIEAKPDLLYLSTVLLPLIESLLVVNKFTDASSTDFIDFTTAHSKILNTMVRNNPSLMSGSFAVLVRNSSMLDFENKRSFFFSRLHDRSQRARPHYPTINLNVRRARVFEDSYHVFLRKTGDEIKYGKLNVKFYDEEGVDAGGVTREWFGVLARQMFNPDYALFQPQAADSLTYQPNKASAINEYHLEYFRFVGRIIGKAIHDQRLLEAYFSRAVYKHMLGKPVDHRDLESIDPEYYKSLVWMLDNDIDGIIDLTFSVERDEFGVTEVVDLIPNGRNIPVTNENKHDYVRRIADQRLSIEIKDQMDALLRGLYEIVPKDLLQIFSERELELLISGLPEVEVEDWQANTNLVNFSHSDPVIRYFWRAVRSFSHQERVALLQFVTGSSRVPLDGFKGLQGMHGTTKFSIHKATGTDGLPSAHTCFNQLDLPQYDSYEKLRRQLLYAITEGSTGFALA